MGAEVTVNFGERIAAALLPARFKPAAQRILHHLEHALYTMLTGWVDATDIAVADGREAKLLPVMGDALRSGATARRHLDATRGTPVEGGIESGSASRWT